MNQHKYLFVFGNIILAMFLIYVYVCEHKIMIDDDVEWTTAFEKATSAKATSAMVAEDVRFVTHDLDVWYYKGRSTCVAFGDFEDTCDYREAFCAKGDPPQSKFGDRLTQAKAVVVAINAGGEHPLCPLVYPGTS